MKYIKGNVIKCLFLAFFLVPIFSFSQVNTFIDIQKIRRQGLDSSKLRELAINLTDVFGPRLSGTEGCQLATEWTAKTLRAMGLSNTLLKPWGEFGKGWQMEKFYIALASPYYQPMIGVPQAWTGSTKGLVKAEVVLVDATTPEQLFTYKGKLNGKIVIQPLTEELEASFEPLAKRFTEEELMKMGDIPEIKADPDPFIRNRNKNKTESGFTFGYLKEFVEKEGAIAILANSGSWGVVRSYGDRSGRFLDSLGIPVIDITYEHYARMVRLIERKFSVEMEMEVSNRLVSDYSKGYNVFAEIPGSDKKLKDEIVMIGAHIDSWHGGTGGNDNGSGVILCMEVMRILKASGLSPKRTIRIAIWGSEEQGLLGSKNWVNENVFNSELKKAYPEYDKISAYYNFDYGTGRIRGIFLNNNIAYKPIFNEFFEPIKDLGVQYMSLRSPGGSDHLSFNNIGIPGFAFIQDRIEYGRGYHTNMDTFERIHLGDLKQAAVVVAALVYQTANYSEKLPRK
jgi:hypothetical protein